MGSDIRSAIYEAIGQASMCWESPDRAGSFDSTRAIDVGNELTETIDRLRPQSGKWTQGMISRWTCETFGEPRSNLSIAVRANEEMAELLRCLSRDDWDCHAREEIADVIITLCRLATRLEGDMSRDIDAKMERNLKRTWTIGPDGHGDHIEPTAPDTVDALWNDEMRTERSGCARCGGTGVLSAPVEPMTITCCSCK